jgi:alkylation response protein AidB-like acyl-CoA dehydrogenase
VSGATTAASARSPLAAALDAVAAGAPGRDRDPRGCFPTEAVVALERAGAFAPPEPEPDGAYGAELALLRAVASADLGVARILDGHLNAVERLRVHAAPDLREQELAAIAAGMLRAGVWGADPVPGTGEGEPAVTDGHVIRGVKTFCSGAGGLDRALVLARRQDDVDGPPSAAWVDMTDDRRVHVDREWFRGGGMRSSASHRVVFDDAPVLALLGEPGALTRQPWFARDAVRTAATWAGAADAAAQDALEQLAARPESELSSLAAGEIMMLQRTVGLWLDEGVRVLGDAAAAPPADADAARVAAQLRGALAAAIRALLDTAERALGSRPAATGTALDRAARDLRLFLLQHRLEPILARDGAAALAARRRA